MKFAKLCWLHLSLVFCFAATAWPQAPPRRNANVAKPAALNPALEPVFVRILQLEDARSLGDGELVALLEHSSVVVRERAALALGRIGDKRATAALLKTLAAARPLSLRGLTVFALGEMEDAAAAAALLEVLNRKTEPVLVRARAAEALGKIAALPPNVAALGPEQIAKINQALLAQLPAPGVVLSPNAKTQALLAVTALMRLKQAASVEPLAHQLKARDAALRATAANALFRLGQPLTPVVPRLLAALADRDTDVRANSARALGVSKAPVAFKPLLALLEPKEDKNDRVQVSAVRGLAALADGRAAEPLVNFGVRLLERYEAVRASGVAHPAEINTLLEVVAALGGFKDAGCGPFLHRLRTSLGAGAYTEIEAALVGLGEKEFWYGLDEAHLATGEERKAVNLVQALAELNTERARAALLQLCEQAEDGKLTPRTIGELLRALNRTKVPCPPGLARRQLRAADPSVRALAATLLTAQPTAQTTENFAALSQAYENSSGNLMGGARLALLNAIAKFQTPQSLSVVKTAATDADPRVRRRAGELLKQFGETGATTEAAAGTDAAASPHDAAFYARLLKLETQRVVATLHTSKGAIKVELFAREAPLTVENFVALARQGFLNGSPFHRIVPNFVAQGGGDPRNAGGPGYQIRCEINQRVYLRGTLGMALAGKDTGSSQFFFCHAPQPHLDGGYTVFGQVLSGMDVVDQLTRDDVIERVEIAER